jgi:hypothetical protein
MRLVSRDKEPAEIEARFQYPGRDAESPGGVRREPAKRDPEASLVERTFAPEPAEGRCALLNE